ncbi:YidC/Oxa1 family membrane protein insertase [Numidum massiliense]|uniref:YidC/Oxa1 family membrane protein insertase n=1 Tax=Numidum massiliense TaxID=1522315 RepID=UPI0009E8A1F4|nr:YidC/Oxa1 family membrane protein insertase [Numidum massiliense]
MVLLALFIRVALFGLNLRIARQQIVQKKIKPLLDQIQVTHKNNQEKLLRETLKLNQTYGIKPFRTMMIGLVQAPVFMSMYGLFAKYGATMTSIVIPWMATLSESDPLHIVPIVYAVLTFVSFLIPLTNDMAVTQSLPLQMALAVVFTAILMTVMWRFPVALVLYWVTNALLALAEKMFYRTQWGKRLLQRGIPEVHLP